MNRRHTRGMATKGLRLCGTLDSDTLGREGGARAGESKWYPRRGRQGRNPERRPRQAITVGGEKIELRVWSGEMADPSPPCCRRSAGVEDGDTRQGWALTGGRRGLGVFAKSPAGGVTVSRGL